MSKRLPFVCLPANEQARARAMFFDARNSDGYLYELDRDGRVLCRNRYSTAPILTMVATLRSSTKFSKPGSKHRRHCDERAPHFIQRLGMGSRVQTNLARRF